MEGICIETKITDVSLGEFNGKHIQWNECTDAEPADSVYSCVVGIRAVSLSNDAQDTSTVYLHLSSDPFSSDNDVVSFAQAAEPLSFSQEVLHSSEGCPHAEEHDIDPDSLFLNVDENIPLLDPSGLVSIKEVSLTVNGDWSYFYVLLHLQRIVHLQSPGTVVSDSEIRSDRSVEQRKKYSFKEYFGCIDIGKATVEIPFNIRVCSSKTNLDVSFLDFFDCEVSNTLFREMTISNNSEIDTTMIFSLPSDSEWTSCFDFADYDTGVVLPLNEESEPYCILEAFSTVRVRMNFTAHPRAFVLHQAEKSVEEFELSLCVRNSRNSLDTKEVPIHGSVSFSSLQIHSDELDIGIEPSVMDFGDCYSSLIHGQTLRLTNIRQSTSVISLSSDSPGVWFSLSHIDESEEVQRDRFSDALDVQDHLYDGSLESNEDYFVSPIAGTPAGKLFSPVSSEDHDSNERVDEIVLPPGHERILHVWLNPRSPPETNEAGKLFRFNFHIYLVKKTDTSVFMKTIPCKVNVCDSVISLNKYIVNLGDCAVGITKREFVKLSNVSDLPTTVNLHFRSSNLFVGQKVFNLDSHTTVSVPINYHPRNANPEYRKELIFSNQKNPHDEHVLEVRASSIDLEGTSMHSLFYKLLVTGSRSLDPTVSKQILNFGTVSVGSPSIVSVSLINVTESILNLQFSPSLGIGSESLQVYATTNTESHLVFKKNLGEKSLPSPNLNVNEDSSELLKGVEDGSLAQISSIDLVEYQKCKLFFVFNATRDLCHSGDFIGHPKHVSCAISIQLSLLEQSWKSSRSIPVHANVCQSVLKLEQSHINFGSFMHLQKLEKSLLLRNLSVVPSFYRIETSGSISSGDIQFEDDSGMVRPLGQIEIPFVFNPTMAGKFLEKIFIRNIKDPANDLEVTMKADIQRPVNFWIKNMELNFDYCLVNSESKSQRVLIKNISARKRSFKLKSDLSVTPTFSHPTLVFKLGTLFFSAESKSVIEREEEKENLERKLRIALRKGKKEKSRILQVKLENLAKEAINESERYETNVKSNDLDLESTMQFQNQVVFSLEPNAVQSIILTLLPVPLEEVRSIPLETTRTLAEAFKGSILVYEQNNKEYIRNISYLCNICYSEEAFGKATANEFDLRKYSSPSPTRPLKLRESCSKYTEKTFLFSIGEHEANDTWEDPVIDSVLLSLDIESRFIINLPQGRSLRIPFPKRSESSKIDDPLIIFFKMFSSRSSLLFVQATVNSTSEHNLHIFQGVSVESTVLELLPSKPRNLGLCLRRTGPISMDHSFSLGSLDLCIFDRKRTLIRSINVPITAAPVSSPLVLGITGNFVHSVTLDIHQDGIQNTNISLPLHNECSKKIPFSISFDEDSPLSLRKSAVSFLNPDSRTILELVAKCSGTGTFTSTVIFHDLLNDLISYIPIVVIAKYPPLIVLSEHHDELYDFGNFYVQTHVGDTQCDKVVPIRVSNSQGVDFMLSVKTTLPSQIEVYTDSKLRVNARRLLFMKNRSLVLYARLRLKYPSRLNQSGEVLSISGGIIFSIRKMSSIDLEPIQRLSKKFSALLGQSVLQVLDSHGNPLDSLDFGCVDSNSESPKKIISLRNRTVKLPLRYSLRSTRSLKIALLNYDDFLIQPNDDANISLALEFEGVGIVRGVLHVLNVSCPSQMFDIPFYGFLQDPSLFLTLPRSSLKYYQVDFGTVYVESSDNSKKLSALHKQSFELSSQYDLELIFASDTTGLTITSASCGRPDDDDFGIDDLPSGYTRCSPMFRTSGRSFVSFELSFDTLALEGGCDVSKHFNSYILLYDRKTSLAKSVIQVSCELSVSICKLLASSIEIGGIMFDQQELIETCLQIENLSDSPAQLRIHSDFPCVLLEKDKQADNQDFVVPPKSVYELFLWISPHEIPAGEFVYPMFIQNLRNPENSRELNFSVVGEKLGNIVQFSRLHEENPNRLKLPSLFVPAGPDLMPSEEWFEMKNVKPDQDLAVSAKCIVFPEFENLIVPTILFRSSNTEVANFVLAGGTSEEFRIRLKSISDVLLPSELYSAPSTAVCSIVFSSESFSMDETLQIDTNFKLGYNFLLSHTSLDLIVPSSASSFMDYFWISNISNSEELQYMVEVSEPVYFKCFPTSGRIKADESEKLQIVVDLNCLKCVDQFRGTIVVMNSVAREIRRELTVSVRFREEKPVVEHSENFESDISPDLTSVTSPDTLPRFHLRGATEIVHSTNRFSIDLGQKPLNSGFVEWDISLENVTDSPVDFFVRILGDLAAEEEPCWLQLSTKFGMLEKCNDTQTISLLISTENMGIFSTYLLVENRQNPSDLRTIRVEIEVVANMQSTTPSSGQLDSSSIFEVFVDGSPSNSQKKLSIDKKDVCFGHTYRNRSFVIRNLSDSPLDFVLSSNLDPSSATRLYFSLSTTTLKLFSTLTVLGKHSVRVYVHFQPRIEESMKMTDRISYPEFSHRMKITLNINCRLIRNFQESILFTANCIFPQMSLSNYSFSFSDRSLECILQEANHLDLFSNSMEMTVTNIFDIPLSFSIRNDSQFFNVFISDTGKTSDTIENYDESRKIIVSLNLSTIRENMEMLLQDKYVEEHFTIYNRSRLSEKSVISLRFTTEKLKLFYLAPGSKKSYPFSKLEESIINFLRSFDLCFHSVIHSPEISSLRFKRLLDILPSQQFSDLVYDYHYITDELVFYGLKGSLGHFSFQLADLLYSVVLNHKLFSMVFRELESVDISAANSLAPLFKTLSLWNDQLRYFLEHFPTRSSRDRVVHLRKLLKSTDHRLRSTLGAFRSPPQ